MPEQPLVSIIIPSYNQGKYIEQTILSVLGQDYNNIELIIIDGGSTDETKEIILKYDSNIKYWVSEIDRGQTHAIIKGIEHSNGKYLTWLCSDDIIEPSMINLSVFFLETYPEIALTYGNRTRIDSKGNIIGFSRSYVNRYFFRYGLGLPQETVLFRRDLYDEVGGLNENLQMVMDYDLWCRLYTKGRFFYIPVFLGRFRSHKENKSTSFSSELKVKGFNGKFTAEFSEVYNFHFHSKFSSIKRKIALFLNGYIFWLNRKTKKYRNLINIIQLRMNE